MRVILDVDEAKLEELDDLAGFGFELDPRYGLQKRRDEPYTVRCIGDFPDEPRIELDALPALFPCVVGAKLLLNGSQPANYWLKCAPGSEMSVRRALEALGAEVLGIVMPINDGDAEYLFRYAGPLDAIDDIRGVTDAVSVPSATAERGDA